ncbi:hypothetical protein KFL_000270310 [Klebsormidium nitens]|uniref:Uncharacterized protein n=1 Tax=Klebsormidium nitens TaxID=105231 RepID=A0A1Y1HNG3_KLENI|nr:hypothetical protein KFL_000270310 [Klebsormidium nitens]|eukprot:GAQ79272.1 hypothetical protein KFL_000270310 [Klebsormidium nitens]
MTGAKKSAFAGQGKGWRKGVKGIGVKKKPSDGDEPVRTKKRKVKRPQNGDGEATARVKMEQAGLEGTGEEGILEGARSGGSETETDSAGEKVPPQRKPRKPFQPGPPLGSNLEVSTIPSDLESEGSEDDLDERTPEGQAAARRRGFREMGDLYGDECLAFCGELLALQKQWRQDFEAPAPGYVVPLTEFLFDEAREAPGSAPPSSEPPPFVALFKKLHAPKLSSGPKRLWQKSEDGNLFMRGQSGNIVIRRKKLKEKRRRQSSEGEEDVTENAEGVLVRRRKTRKDKGVAKTHGKYVKPGDEGQEGQTVLFLTPEEEDLAKMRRMIQNELAASVETGPIDAPRSQAPWTDPEREAFKRSLFLFGLGRLEKVQSHMRQCHKKSRQLLGDVTDAAYQLLEQCLAHIEGSDATLTQKRMQDLLKRRAHGDDVETGPEVAARVGVFAKLPTNAKSWVRRLQLLDGLDHALHVCGSKATQKDAFKIILLIAEDGTKPATWWTRNADIALMVGVYRHGYANYDAVRVDPEFAEAFAPALEAEGAAEPVRRKRRRKKQAEGEGEEGDQEDADGEGVVAESFIESLVEGDLAAGGSAEVEIPIGGVVEPSRLAPGLEVKLVGSGGSGEKRPLIDLDLNAPAEDVSPRGGDGAGVSGGGSAEKSEKGSPPEKSGPGEDGEGGAKKKAGKKRRKSGEEEGEEDGDEKEGVGGWPASVPLTLRLKRLITHLARGLKKPVGIHLQKEEGPAAPAAGKAGKRPAWSKKEKQDLVRALTAFGLPETPDGQPDWAQLLQSAGLPKKAESSALACFEELLAEATSVLRDNKAMRKRQRKPIKHMCTCTCSHCKQKRLESLPGPQQKARRKDEHGGELGPPVLINVIAAKKLLDRLETLEILRKALALIPGDWTSKELGFYRTADLPRWWQAGLHDREFSLGVIKHGIGNWAAIGGDPSLAFPQPEDFKNEDEQDEGAAPEGGAESAPAEKGDDVRVTSGAGEEGGGEEEGTAGDNVGGHKEGSAEPPGGGWAFPGSKVLLRRLKYNTQILKRSVARHQKKTLPASEADHRPDPGKAPKRQGQESAVDGARKPTKRRRSNDDEQGAHPKDDPQPSTVGESESMLGGGGNPLDQALAASVETEAAGHDRKPEGESGEDNMMVDAAV